MFDHDITRREIEIKIDLGEFTSYLKMLGYLGQMDQEVRHQNAFFDTEDGRLAQAGWALRVRAEDSRGLVTVKGRRSEVGAAHVRDEIETEIPRGQALDCLGLRMDVMNLAIPPIRYVKAEFGEDLQVAVLAKFVNFRQRKELRIREDVLVLEVDKTEFSDGSVDYEIEVELSELEQVESATDCLRKLFATLDIPFRHQSESKYARALRRMASGSR